MRKNQKKEELSQFKIAAMKILANKLFCEFMAENEKHPTEPEYFFEAWLPRNVDKLDEETKLWTWRYFMENLIDFRKFKKSL
jgi:hypothetical protein